MPRSAAKKNTKSSGEEKEVPESVKDVIVRLASMIIMLCYGTQ